MQATSQQFRERTQQLMDQIQVIQSQLSVICLNPATSSEASTIGGLPCGSVSGNRAENLPGGGGVA